MDFVTVSHVIIIRVALLSGIFPYHFWVSPLLAKVVPPHLYILMLLLFWLQ